MAEAEYLYFRFFGKNRPSGYFMDMPISSENSVYRVSQEFVCPQCGMRAVVREEDIVEGLFEVVGKRYVCSSCGWQIPENQVEAPAKGVDSRQSSDNSALEALFGDETPIDDGPMLSDTDTTRFCKNCRHYLKSPFLSRCLLHKRDVDPMGICEHFCLPADE